MPNLTDLTGLASAASVIMAALLLFPGIARLPRPRLAATLAATFVLALIPLGDLPLAAYLRGATGDMSITTIVLLWIALINAMRPTENTKPFALSLSKGRNALIALSALTALIFYPLALGVTMFDPYRMGYGDPLFIVALLAVTVFAWFRKSHLLVLCITLATLAWSFGWYESNNLWDYLLDPFLSIYALWVSAAMVLKRLLNLRH
jgi:hypothetical protein